MLTDHVFGVPLDHDRPDGEQIEVFAREVVAATGFEPGAVAPFRLRAVGKVLMEQTVLSHPRVWIGAGSSAHMAGLSPAELQRLTGAETADLVEPDPFPKGYQ